MTKPKVAFFDFASCEGDQLQVANLEEKLVELLGHIDVVSFREIMKEHSDDYDIAFIEGSCTRVSDEDRLKKIRSIAKIVVAMGSCSSIGGINCLKNTRPLAEVRKEVYGDKAGWYETYTARPIDAIIKVDFKLPGCPINKDEFLALCKALLTGQKFNIPNHPVCVECKLAENICAFEKDMSCVGPVTRAGCGACCITEGAVCWGCRGLVDDPNRDSHKEVLNKYGLSVEEIMNKFNLYFAWQEAKK